MSCGVSGSNIIIEPGYCSEQSLRKGEGNEEEMTSGRHFSCKSDSLRLLRGDVRLKKETLGTSLPTPWS